MIGADERNALLEKLISSGRLSSARVLRREEITWAKSRQLEAAVEGHFIFDGCPISLRVGLAARFPLVLPDIYVVSPYIIGCIPHVEHDGRICYRSDEGLLIKYDAPLQVIEEAIDAAVRTVTDGLSGANWIDFVDELEAYWNQLAPGNRLPSYVEPNDELRRIDLGYRERKPIFAADSLSQVRAFMNGRATTSPPLHVGIYVPLMNSVLTERFYPKQFESLEWAKSFVSRHLSAKSQKELERLAAKDRLRHLVVLGVPHRKEGKSLIALEYRDVVGGHPFNRGHTSTPVRYVALERRDRAVTTARCRGDSDMSKKRVLIVGCGSVGGHLAFNLARAGIGHLTLIDPESLTPQNTFRHISGHSAIGVKKVDALKHDITHKVPYIVINAIGEHIEYVLRRNAIDLRQFDLVVYAAGDPTLGLYLNDLMHRTTDSPAMLFSWVEPYGIGGHCLLSNTGRPNHRGCLGCLFSSPIDDDVRRNRADFAGPDQHFAKAVSGCATMYTPYANLDAVRTAELSARLAIDFLGNRTEGHPLLSWKGDSAAFRAAGFATSMRYLLHEQTLWEHRFSYTRHDCRICGSVA